MQVDKSRTEDRNQCSEMLRDGGDALYYCHGVHNADAAFLRQEARRDETRRDETCERR